MPKPGKMKAEHPARTPTDGMPYYCESCGLGWAEFIACEDGPCALESADAARARVQITEVRRKPLSRLGGTKE